MPIHKSLPQIFTLGFAIFSMFFGAGNVIYPMQVGITAHESTWVALIGFLMTGVGAPLLGLYALLLCEGNLFKFFAPNSNSITTFWILLLVLALGPIGASPRCVLLSYQALKTFLPTLSLSNYTIGLGIVLCGILLKKTAAVDMLGKFLSPLLLLLLLLIIGASFGTISEPIQDSQSSFVLFQLGLMQGYQTMDLLAALIFGVTLWNLAHKPFYSKRQASTLYFWSFIFGGILLASIYFGLGWAAHLNADLLQNTSKEMYLNVLAFAILGNLGGKFACAIIFLACLTTIIALTLSCCDCVLQWFHASATTRKEHLSLSLIISFIVVTLIMANLGFAKISSWINIIVQLTYPLLVLIATVRIVQKYSTRTLHPIWVNSLFFLTLSYQSWNVVKL